MNVIILEVLLFLSIGFNILFGWYLYKIRLRALSKSIEAIEKELDPFKQQISSMSSNILPTPNLVKIIEETIREHLDIEIQLTRHNKTKFGKAIIIKVTENTHKTYPYVNETYIAEKVISIFEKIVGDDSKKQMEE